MNCPGRWYGLFFFYMYTAIDRWFLVWLELDSMNMLDCCAFLYSTRYTVHCVGILYQYIAQTDRQDNNKYTHAYCIYTDTLHLLYILYIYRDTFVAQSSFFFWFGRAVSALFSTYSILTSLQQQPQQQQQR